MKTKIVSGLLLLVLSSPIQAKPFYKSKRFWTGAVIIGASIGVDYGSTAARRGQEVSNPFLGPHPSTGRIAGVAIADFSTEFGLHILLHKIVRCCGVSESKEWNFVGDWTQPTISAITHIPASINNFKEK